MILLLKPRLDELRLHLQFRPHRNETIMNAQDMPSTGPGADHVLQAKADPCSTEQLTQSQEAFRWPHMTTRT